MNPPTSSTAALEEAAWEALDAGDRTRAAEVIERLQAQAPDQVETAILRAELARARGRPDQAVLLYEALFAAGEPTPAESAWLARANYAEVLVLTGRGREAIEQAFRAIHLDPEQPDAYVAAAQGYLLLQQPNNALNLLNSALRIDDELAAALVVRAGLYAATRSFGDALNDYARAIDLMPGELPLYLAVVRVALAVRDERLAINTLDEGIERLPDEEARQQLRTERALLLLRLGRVDEALNALERLAGALQPPPTRFLMVHAEALLEAGRQQDALALYDSLLAREPEHVEALAGKVDTLLALERPHEAAPLLDELVRLDPGADHYTLRADFSLATGEHERARDDYERALALEPSHPTAGYGLALALLDLGEPERALHHIDRVIESHPRDTERRLARAEILLALDRPVLALMDAEQAIGLDEQFVEAYVAGARALEALGRVEEALEELEYAYSLDPGHGETIAALARLLARRGDSDGAALLWKEYRGLPPDEQEPETLDEARRHAERPDA